MIIIVMIIIVLLLKTGKFAYVYMYDQMRVRKEGRKEGSAKSLEFINSFGHWARIHRCR